MTVSNRVVHVSDWAYDIIEYGRRKIGLSPISQREFIDRLINDVLWRKRLEGTAISLKEAEGTVSQMSNSELIKYGLELMEEIEPEKTKELRERLKGLGVLSELAEKPKVLPVK